MSAHEKIEPRLMSRVNYADSSLVSILNNNPDGFGLYRSDTKELKWVKDSQFMLSTQNLKENVVVQLLAP